MRLTRRRAQEAGDIEAVMAAEKAAAEKAAAEEAERVEREKRRCRA